LTKYGINFIIIDIICSRKGDCKMLEIFLTVDEKIKKVDKPTDGCWIALTDPTSDEVNEISELYGIDKDSLVASLDEEERSRIEFEDTYSLILVDIPSIEEKNGKDRYITIPLAIIVTDKVIITVCLEDTYVLRGFIDGCVKGFFTNKRTRFILQILYRNASMFLLYLRNIDKKSEEIEEKMHISTKNRELIDMLQLEKSLVYISTSLRSNEVVLEKLLRSKAIKQYPEDTELLEDVIIENKQAIEMSNIYSGILSNMTEAFASIISNNMNAVMKFLTTVTIVMSIPTIIASYYGMNVGGIYPGMNSHHGFILVILGSLVITIIAAYYLAKKDLF